MWTLTYFVSNTVVRQADNVTLHAKSMQGAVRNDVIDFNY